MQTFLHSHDLQQEYLISSKQQQEERSVKSKYKLPAGRRTRVEVLIFEKGKFTAPSPSRPAPLVPATSPLSNQAL